MDRRGFFRVMIAGVALAVVTRYAWLIPSRRSAIAHLRETFADLPLDPDVVPTFVDDCWRYRGAMPPPPWPEYLYSDFLLSTSLFRRNARSEGQIYYVGYYDPARMPCANPFAQFDFD